MPARWRALLRALERAGRARRRLPGRELIELLEQLRGAAARPPTAPGAVLLAEPLAIRARRFRAVFVCGLQEGEFPRSGHARAVPLRRAPPGAGRAPRGCGCAPREDALARERYLFYACVSRATERVVLSYRSSDEEGNLALPSPFIADVAELLVERVAASAARRRLLADVVWPAPRRPTARELDARAGGRRGAAPAATGPAPERRLGELALGHVRHTRGPVRPGRSRPTPTARCKWLVERELRPEPLEPEPEPLVRGS